MSLEDLMSGGISALMSDTGDIPGTLDIALNKIKPDPEQPRKYFDEYELQELANSIKEHGVLQPISVSKIEADDEFEYVINFGERRYQACILLGLTHIPAIINNDFSAVAQMVENLNRADLTLMERVRFIGKLIADGYKQTQISKELGKKDDTWVSRHVTISKAPAFIIDAIESEKIQSLEVAQTLASWCKKGKAKEVRIFVDSFSTDEQITSHTVRKFVAKLKEKSKASSDTNNVKDPSPALKKTVQKLAENEKAQLKDFLNNDKIAHEVLSLSPEAVKALSKLLVYMNETGDTESIFLEDTN